jgi:transcriptional/translational regulatory protein YebC/TACO1
LVKLSEAGRKKLSNLIEKIYEIEEIQGIYCSGEEYVDKETQ